MKEELIEKLEKLKDLIQIENEVDVDSSVDVINEAIQALSQSESKPITKEEIEYRIKEEYKKHRNSSILVGDKFDWAKIAASKIYALITN